MNTNRRGPVLIAELDRADRHNALDIETVVALAGLLEPQDGVAPPLVITGKGPTFCSGFDLTTFGEGATFVQHADRLLALIERYPAPVIAALNGPAIGMGCVLATACDIRIGCERSWLEIPAARVGVVMGSDYIGRVTRRLGIVAAQQLFVASRRIDARRAYELGALHALVDDPLAEACEWATHASSLKAESIAAHKAFINDSRSGGSDAG